MYYYLNYAEETLFGEELEPNRGTLADKNAPTLKIHLLLLTCTDLFPK